MAFKWFDQWLLHDSIKGRYDTIYLVDMTLNQHEDAFVEFARQALDLIQCTDPRRYQRVRREIHYLTNAYLVSGGTYRRNIRCCRVDFERYYAVPLSPQHEWYLAAFAALIVHEATHGRLYSLGIPYNRKTWRRVERICYAETARFAARLQGKYYNLRDVVPPFDEKRYQQMRQPIHRIRTRTRILVPRFWQDLMKFKN